MNRWAQLGILTVAWLFIAVGLGFIAKLFWLSASFGWSLLG